MAEHRKGKISRLYVNEMGCGIELDSYQTAPSTYFWIVHTTFPSNGRQYAAHGNYKSLYALALMAATNRYRVWLRLRDETDDEVQYIVVDW